MTQIGRIKFHKREVSIIYFYSLIPETGIKGGVNDESTLNTNTQVVSLAGKISNVIARVHLEDQKTDNTKQRTKVLHSRLI